MSRERAVEKATHDGQAGNRAAFVRARHLYAQQRSHRVRLGRLEISFTVVHRFALRLDRRQFRQQTLLVGLATALQSRRMS